MTPTKVRTLSQLRAVVSSGSALVIVDAARPPALHSDPEGCVHVQEGHFITKVVENRERNGSYFVVGSLEAARRQWPQIRLCGSAACSAAAGAEVEGAEEGSTLEAVLRAATGLTTVRARKREPVGAEALVSGWQSTQRLALGRSEHLVLRTWPGELKPQAAALYAGDRARRLLELAARSEWEAAPLPHLAYNGSQPADRFYFPCPMSIDRYVSFWSHPENLARAGGHPLESIGSDLWPWLCESGLAEPSRPGALDELDRFTERLRLRRADAHLRPSIEVTRTFDASLEEDPATLTREVAEAVREVAGTLQEDLRPPPRS